MSEHEAYVACTCFRDGLTSDPPVPRDQLGHDRFGNVVLLSGGDPDDDPESLWDWRWDEACDHPFGRLERIWKVWLDRIDQRVLVALDAIDSANLYRVLRNADYCPNPGVIASPELAADALPELERLLTLSPGGRTRVLADQDGREVAVIDPSGLVELDDFTPLGDVAVPWDDPPGTTQLGLVGDTIVVREEKSKREVLRANDIRFQVRAESSLLADFPHRNDYQHVDLYSIPEGEHVDVLLRRPWFHHADIDLYEMARPTELRVGERPLQMCDVAWWLRPLRAFLSASIRTGNPVVGYHNGASFGFAES